MHNFRSLFGTFPTYCIAKFINSTKARLDLNLFALIKNFRISLPKEQRKDDMCSCNLVSIEKTLHPDSSDVYYASFSNKVSTVLMRVVSPLNLKVK